MVSPGADNTDVESVSLIPASESVDDIDAAPGVEVVDGPLSIDAPDLQRRL